MRLAICLANASNATRMERLYSESGFLGYQLGRYRFCLALKMMDLLLSSPSGEERRGAWKGEFHLDLNQDNRLVELPLLRFFAFSKDKKRPSRIWEGLWKNDWNELYSPRENHFVVLVPRIYQVLFESGTTCLLAGGVRQKEVTLCLVQAF